MKNFSETPWEEEYCRFEADPGYAREKTLREISALVGRVIGQKWTECFSFRLSGTQEGGTDCFSVWEENGKICIDGNNGISLAAGFNYYLKNYAFVNYNPVFVSHLHMPDKLPSVPEKIVQKTPYQVRYALNFCTYSYTMAFWGWKEYEALLDWFAMNGVNLMLDIVGQEEVQRRFLKAYGYTDEEVKSYIPGPAYLPWFYMQNMTSFGGPLPENWFEERVELGRRMHDRMQTFGITPVLMGYSGMVPQDFARKHPDAEVIPQGEWCGFQRPYMLKTYGTAGKDYFAEAADLFYAKQREVFGRVTRYFAVDPFHEGGRMGGMDPTTVYYTVQKKMLDQDPDAVWLLMQWQGQITHEKIRNLADPKKTLILDLQADRRSFSDVMEKNGTPWIWSMVHNFGGRMGLDGDLPTLAEDIPKKYHESQYMVGIGAAPEALNHTPIEYDLLFDMTWTDTPVNCVEYIKRYVSSRYGSADPHLLNAWKILLDTVLARKKTYAQGAPESIICAQPREQFKSASTWGSSELEYDPRKLEKALPELIAVYETYQDCETFRYDLVDTAKQVLASGAAFCHRQMMKAYTVKNLREFERYSGIFLDMIRLTDEILRCSPHFSVDPWIEQARHTLSRMSNADQDLFEFNARALITTWGGRENCDAGLLEYSNRQWAGLVREYYLPRWEDFVRRYGESLIQGLPPEEKDYFPMEWAWANGKKSRESSREAVPNLKELAQKVWKYYSITALEKEAAASCSSEIVDLALNRKVAGNVEAAAGYPYENLTDGKLDTVWKAADNTWPVILTVDLERNCEIEEIAFVFPQVAGEFPVRCGIELCRDGVWESIPMPKQDRLIGSVSVRCTAFASAVRFTFTLKDPATEAVAELAALRILGREEAQV